MPNGHHIDYAARGAETNLWSRVKPRPRQRPDPCEEPCTPRCPACGGLQCLCRPRFFPGQLLTDQDLNRLQQYVIDKNRLHNRYLHGWGVACGLEVVCDVCEPGHVVVRPGYALSPCGDDIIVCNPQSVDICALINACEPREPLCESPYETPPRDCTGGRRKWVLAICYDERPVRGVAAQLGAGDTAGSAKCKCGGSGGCGCGGGSHGGCSCGGTGGKQHECSCGGHETKANGRKPYKPQCEPTQICEGYKFIAYPAPEEDGRKVPFDGQRGGGDLIWAWLFANRTKFGPLVERVLCCLTRGMELRDRIRQGKAIDQQFAMSTYQEYAAALAEFAEDFAIHRCSFVGRTMKLREEAKAFDWNAPYYGNDNAFKIRELNTRVEALDIAWLDIVSECLCSALLPACPRPVNTNCVPLAVVTISDGQCRVVEICNWSERKLLISWPTVTYWLSWLPWHLLMKWIAGMCCGPRRGREAYRFLMLMIGVMFSGMKTSAGVPMMAGAMPFGAAARRAGAQPRGDHLKEAFEADNLLGHMLTEFEDLRTKGAEVMEEPGWAGLVARLSDGAVLSPRAADDPKLAGVLRRLESAEAKLLSQEKTIAELKKKGGK